MFCDSAGRQVATVLLEVGGGWGAERGGATGGGCIVRAETTFSMSGAECQLSDKPADVKA